MTPATKAGAFGTLYRYRLRYRDVSGSPEFSCCLWAYSVEHAEEKFYSAPDAEGWEVVSMRREAAV